MGITLLVNPNCQYDVVPILSDSPYIFSCQVSQLLIHCLYLPPSLPDEEAIAIIDTLPKQTHPSQTNTIVCGDLNARNASLLGDTRTSTRGTMLADWIAENGYTCWNADLAYGIPTLSSQNRLNNHSSWSSIVDLFLSSNPLVDPSMLVHDDTIGSDHLPVSLTCKMPAPPLPRLDHPRILWKLSLLNDPNSKQLYQSLFLAKVGPFKQQLLAKVKYAIDVHLCTENNGTLADLPNHPNGDIPNLDALADDLTAIVHASLDEALGRKKKVLPPGNAWFWTETLDSLVQARATARKKWKRTPDGIRKALRWKEYIAACEKFTLEMKRRKRETWKKFCEKLSNGPLAETTATIKRLRRNRTISPGFSHPEGPSKAASIMSRHLRSVFAGDNLPTNRPTAPPQPTGPNLSRNDVIYLVKDFLLPLPPFLTIDELEKPIVADPKRDCPFNIEMVNELISKKLARRKAPGVDHLRTEMLLPILDDFAPVLVLLFYLCWIWSKVPSAWCTAQVIPIYKKGNPLEAGNYRPISLTSTLRKLMELCLYEALLHTAPPLDIAQGGFRADRGTLDQAMSLHELSLQHAADHFGEPPVLCFLDIKQAYDSVDRNIIWRQLETHVSEPMLGVLQGLFDNVKIEVLVSGAKSPTFWPGTGVLQGSILSPFLYSIYINSLPSLLRTINLPSSRVHGRMPKRIYEGAGLWLNCLLYADDVVLIGTAETMPRLLKKAEEHSFSLGYRWNPAKCVVVNSPSFFSGDVTPLKLYGTALPVAESFKYLGIPFNSKAQIDSTLLVQQNARSALVAMRSGLQPLGIYSASFSRLTSSRLYSIFIRPKLEYGLATADLLVKDLKILEKAQDQCLRLCFGGHSKASTMVYKHLNYLPSMREREAILTFKMMIRMLSLHQDTLLGSLRSHILQMSTHLVRFLWPKLLKKNSLCSFVCPVPAVTNGRRPPPTHARLKNWVESGGNIKAATKAYRVSVLSTTLAQDNVPVLLYACRHKLGIDPILILPMTLWERSRLVRWKMGWLPARPIACRCGHPHASRNHLLLCLSVAERLDVPADSAPNPLDFVLNQLPKLSCPPSIHAQRSDANLLRWNTWWPTICAIMVEIEMICLPDEEFSEAAQNTEGLTLLKWLFPVYLESGKTVSRSSLYNYL